MVANILPTDPSLTLGVGVKRSKFNFSEYGHVAYQFKGNDISQNFIRIIRRPPPPLCPPLEKLLTGI